MFSTKFKTSALRTLEADKVTKAAAKRETVTDRERLKQVVERLSIIEGSTNAKSSSPQLTPDVTPHVPLQAPSALTARDFEVGGTLGKGKFGRVFLARPLTKNYICALEITSKEQCSDEEEEKLIWGEIEVHQNLAHKNILKLLSWFHDPTNIYLVLEYAPGGSLYTQLKKQRKGRFYEPTSAQYIMQVTEALRYMHRDVKPENILLGLHNEI
jgi:serine/threonine protein kinase